MDVWQQELPDVADETALQAWTGREPWENVWADVSRTARVETRLAMRQEGEATECIDKVYTDVADTGMDPELESGHVRPMVESTMSTQPLQSTWEREPARPAVPVLTFVSDCTDEVKDLLSGCRKKLRKAFRRRLQLIKGCDVQSLGKVPMCQRPCCAANRCICTAGGQLLARLKAKIDAAMLATFPRQNKERTRLLLDGYVTATISSAVSRRDFHVSLQYRKPKIATFIELEVADDRRDMSCDGHVVLQARTIDDGDGRPVAGMFTVWDLIGSLDLVPEFALILREVVVSEKILAVNRPNAMLVRDEPLAEVAIWLGAESETQLIKDAKSRGGKRSRADGSVGGPQRKKGKRKGASPGG